MRPRTGGVVARVSTIALVALTLGGCTTNASVTPDCTDPGNDLVVLIAQSVPSATLVPCLSTMPVGWFYGGSTVRDGITTLSLSSSVAGELAASLELTASCDPGDAPEVVPAPDEVGARAYVSQESLDPYRATRTVVFEGGCARTTYNLPPGFPASLSLEADAAFSFLPRADVVAAVASDPGGVLCGAEAPPCTDPA